MDRYNNEKELNQLIDKFPESIIWRQKVVAAKAWKLLVYASVSCIGFLSYYFFFIKDLSFDELFSLDSLTILELMLIIVFSIFYVVIYYINASNASSMVYTIYPKHISFEWGYFNKRKVEIPFDDITAVNLVGYDNSEYSTIFFGTNKTYKIKKVEFDDASDRFHITFENIKQGKKVHELLTLLQRKARKYTNSNA